MKTRGSGQKEAPSDDVLVSLVQSGDTAAFGTLTDRYMPALVGRAGRYANVVGFDVEDFLQEGMLALYRAACGFRPDGGASFGTYAMTCITNSMTNAVRAHMKGQHQRAHLQFEELDEKKLSGAFTVVSDARSAEDTYIDFEDSTFRIQQIETLLSDFEQQVLRLYLRGHSYQQIASILSTAPKAVDNALQRVRKKLRPEF